MKKFLLYVFIVLALAVGAAVFIRFRYPETRVGGYVEIGWNWSMEKYALAEDWAVTRWKTAFAKEETAEKPAAVPEEPVREKEPPAEETSPAESAPQAAASPAATPKVTRGWFGLVDANRISGPRLSASSLRGKVVLIYSFDAANERSLALLPRVQQIYSSFKHKPFAVLGSVSADSAAAVKAALKSRRQVTFPVYSEAGMAPMPPAVQRGATPYFTVIDSRGGVVFRGVTDPEATEAVVDALGNIR